MPSFPPSFTAFFPSSSPLPLLFITFLYYRCRRHLNKHHTTIFYQPSLTTILSPQPPYIPQTCYPVIVNTTSAMLTVSLFAPLPHLPFFHLFFLFPYFLPPHLLSLHLPGTYHHHHYNHHHAHFPFSYTFVFVGSCVTRTVFNQATAFNQDIGSWDVSSVTSIYSSKCLN